MKQLFNKIKPSPLHSDNKEMNKAIDDIRKALDQLYNLLDVSKEGRLTIDGDLKVKDLYVDGDSLYIGGVKLGAPKSAYDEYYLQYLKSDKKIEYVSAATPITETVQDVCGAMFTGNTETLITATYQDADGTIDLVVDDENVALPNVSEVTADYTATFQEMLLCDGTFTVTMPEITASDIGKLVIICNVGTGIITVDGYNTDTFYDETTMECSSNGTYSFKATTTSTWVLT